MSEGTPEGALWGVWQPAWHDVYTSSSTGVVGYEECRSHLAATYRQQLGENAAITPESRAHPCHQKLRLRAWAKVGSGLTEEQAREMVTSKEGSMPVLEGSDQDFQLSFSARQAFEKRD